MSKVENPTCRVRKDIAGMEKSTMRCARPSAMALKQQLEAPQELPPDIASLVAQIEGMTASVSTDKVAYPSLHLSMFEDRLQGSSFG